MSNYRALSCKQDAFIKVLPSGLRDLKWKREVERLLKTRVVDDCKESVSSVHNRTATHTAHREQQCTEGMFRFKPDWVSR